MKQESTTTMTVPANTACTSKSHSIFEVEITTTSSLVHCIFLGWFECLCGKHQPSLIIHLPCFCSLQFTVQQTFHWYFVRKDCGYKNRLRSSIGPSLISPRTKLIGAPTIGLPAVITLKIPLNQQSTRSYYLHSINNKLEQAT